MTLIVYRVDPGQVAVLTDTLFVDGERRPAFVGDKVELLPHLELALVGAGDAELVSVWAEHVRAASVHDVDSLDDVAPEALQGLWRELGCDDRDPTGHGSTVYSFGWSTAASGFRGYSYTSSSGFESRRCPEGLVGIRPAPSFDGFPVDSLDDWVRLACHLRDEFPASIGGDLMLTVLAPGSTTVRRVHRFDDFEAQRDALSERGVLVAR